MAESNESSNNNIFSANDPLDINELASLNEEISNDFIEQLQNKITESVREKNDGDMFEEVQGNKPSKPPEFNRNIDDNFIKKYKAKLRKKEGLEEEETPEMPEHSVKEEEPELKQAEHSKPIEEEPEVKMPPHSAKPEPAPEMPHLQEEPPQPEPAKHPIMKDSSIEKITGGNIIEKPIPNKAQPLDESLDYLDGNVNYTKYVVYIDPENKEFIDSLTVKERKNLINRIIREQDAIALTRRKLSKIQMIVTHAIVAIITVTIAIPFVYWTINASLEATINNYRTSQTIFSQLYKEKGKIRNVK